MTVELRIVRLGLRNFRNIESLDVEPAPRVNVIAGDNGQGKTSLLEALYVVCTSRSFRTEKAAELVRDGAAEAVVRAEIDEDAIARRQVAALSRAERVYSVDGARAARLSAYATRTPVVVFHPGDLDLVSGPASLRRRLLDRVALFLRPESGDHRLRYDRALRSRQATLERRGPAAPELEALERILAVHGSELTRIRAETAERLAASAVDVFRRIAFADLVLEARYQPAGTTDVEAFAAGLAERRANDLRRRGGGFGPQRDDLVVELDGRTARRHASQGQQRLIALALKIAELECVRDARGAHPMLLLDDVSSELDPTRTGAVYEYLRGTPSQVFVTTTRPELFTTPGVPESERADFTLSGGKLAGKSAPFA